MMEDDNKAILDEEYTRFAGLFVHLSLAAFCCPFMGIVSAAIMVTWLAIRPFLRFENEQEYYAAQVYSFLGIG